ncbi:DUF6233 domain-containing protein [Streptomyces sp. NPDC056796]|uniref:DUF6233 domain-containing protein n=1 Tax=Streptomyces sp. NPDC056796 TaxID=3345947 RepID=UPI00367F725F
MHGSGGISRLEKWRATRDYLAWQLRYADHRIRELEAEERRDRHRREQARVAQSWKVQPQRSSANALLHRGSCTLYRNGSALLSREEAVIALAEPGIDACQICNPQTGLR